MLPVSMAMLLLLVAASQAPAIEPETLIGVLESLQPQLEDFRCEYEGTFHFKTEAAKRSMKLKADGLHDTFSGTFVWKRDGSTRASTYHRRATNGKLLREELAMRIKPREAECYQREVDAPLGRGLVEDPMLVNADRGGCLGNIVLIDAIKRLFDSPDLEESLADETVDGVPLKVLSFSFRERRQLDQRFWIELRRGGHVVRREIYDQKGKVSGRVVVRLASFKLGRDLVWMPVSGTTESHDAADKDGEPYTPVEATSVQQIDVIDGTMEFNKRPGAAVFKIDYKPGTPISDNLRQVQTEFGRQKPAPRPTKPEAEATLRRQLAEAEAQRSELVAEPPTAFGASLSPWLVGVAGTSALVLYQRRR